MIHKPLLGAVLAASLMAFGAAAQAQYTAVVQVAPPAPRHEVVPAARAGWVWAPGHYEWRGGEYAWVEGHWLRERVGYEYQAPRWVQRGDGSWKLVGGTWEQRQAIREQRREDRRDARAAMGAGPQQYGRFSPQGDYDRDGIANQYDRDIDGDGVRNRRDRFPYDHRRN
jgi:hypothetical protein